MSQVTPAKERNCEPGDASEETNYTLSQVTPAKKGSTHCEPGDTSKGKEFRIVSQVTSVKK